MSLLSFDEPERAPTRRYGIVYIGYGRHVIYICYPDRLDLWRYLKAYQYTRVKTPHAKCGGSLSVLPALEASRRRSNLGARDRVYLDSDMAWIQDFAV